MAKPYFQKLMSFVAAERAAGPVYPPPQDVFTALRLTPLEEVRVMILGQDPYHGAGQAYGLAFSVRPGVKVPPSLVNIYKELHSDVGVEIPNHGDLRAWAAQGVLLLNAVLTVRAGEAGSHAGKGWESLTDAVIARCQRQARAGGVRAVGRVRPQKGQADHGAAARHSRIGPPQPLSVIKFRGIRPFSRVNAALEEAGRGSIDWQLPMRAQG